MESIYYFGYHNDDDNANEGNNNKIISKKNATNNFINDLIFTLNLMDKKKENETKEKNNEELFDNDNDENDCDSNSNSSSMEEYVQEKKDESDYKGIMFVTDTNFMEHGKKMAKILFHECGIQCRIQTYNNKEENEQLPFENVRYTFRVNEVSINHGTLSFRDRKGKTQKQQILPYNDVIKQIKENQKINEKNNNNNPTKNKKMKI